MTDTPEIKAEILDGSGRKWRLLIPAGVYVDLRDTHGIDLLNEKHCAEMLSDLVKRSEVLIAILDRQATKHGLSPDDVDEMLADPVTAPPAHVALEAALRDFYVMQGAEAMVAVIDRVREAKKTLMNTAMTRINGPTMNRMIEREYTKATTEMDKKLAELEAKQIAEDGLTNSSEFLEPPTGAS